MTNLKALALIFLIGFVVYFNGLFNAFVGDDKEQVINNYYIHSIKNIPSLFSYGYKSEKGILSIYYKPLMPVSLALVYSFAHENTFPYHLIQLLIQIANTYLLFLVLKHFFDRKLSLFLSLFFLVHPLNQEAVQNVSSYQDVLFFLFGIIALFTFMNYKLNLKRVILVSFLLLMSLFSKETGILFFPIILLFSYLFQREKLKLILVSEIAMFAVYIFIRTRIGNFLPVKIEEAPIMDLNFVERLVNVPKIIFYYLRNTIFPTDLSISQQWIVKSINFTDFYLPLFFVILFFSILLFCLFKLKKRKTFLFFFLWFVMGILPHINLTPLDMTVASRWFYLPIVGVIGMASVGLEKIINKKREAVIYSILIVFLVLLSIRTIIRNSNWRTPLTLYSHDISYSKGYIVENNLGDEFFKVGRKEEAKKYFEEAVRDNPKWWIAWNNLGIYAEDKRDYKNAEKYYQKAIAGKLPAAYENLARTYLVSGDLKKAKKFVQTSLKKLPDSPRLWVTLGLIEYKLGNKKEALNAVEKSFKLFPAVSTQNLYNAMQKNQTIE